MTSEDECEAVRAGLHEAFGHIRDGRYVLALPALQALATAHPTNLEAQHACGTVLANLGLAERAEPFLRQAHALAPDYAENQVALGLALLALGHHQEGWTLAAARYRLPGARPPPALPCPEWRGEPLQGRRLVVWPDEGLGDQIQYARFASTLRTVGAEVVFCCWLALEPLFARCLPAAVHAVRTEMQLPQPDYWIMAGLLPLRLGVGAPAADEFRPYLSAARVATPPGARIGVMVRGNPQHTNDAHRSLPAPLARRLLDLPGAISVHPSDTGFADFDQTAALIAGLDLVISVDTAVAHLAGAMGKPVWILLPTIGLDWRWGLSGDRTPWYPSARLFRQPRISDWPAVVDRVIAEVARL